MWAAGVWTGAVRAIAKRRWRRALDGRLLGRRSRALTIVLALSLAIILLSACSGRTNPASAADEGAATPPESEVPADAAVAAEEPASTAATGPAPVETAQAGTPQVTTPGGPKPAASAAAQSAPSDVTTETATRAREPEPAGSVPAAEPESEETGGGDADGVGEAEQEEPTAAPEAVRIRVVRADAAGGDAQPIRGAHVVAIEAGADETAGTARRSDAEGYFTAEPSEERYQVVAAGYWPAREVSPVDGAIRLRPLDVRAIYLPYEQLWNPPSIEWALGLAREGLISAIVIDIKEEGGAVLPLFATEAVRAIDAVVDPGADMASFLAELESLGIYRIARQAVFLDTRLGRSDVETAILTRSDTQLLDNLGLGWTTPFSATARQYNIDIAVQATPYFEEIQFDYIRFPGGPLRVHAETTGEDRSAAVALFAEEAVAALHAAGAAMSVDTFGETAVIRVEDSIGQVLEDLIPHIDYYSPMVYPSTWAPGSFGLEYPAADPELVVRLSIETAVQRVAESGVVGVEVRPWLQDYRDYGPREISYDFAKVLVQIEASAGSGGVGFMLWNPTLLYHTDVLALVAPEAASAGAGAR